MQLKSLNHKNDSSYSRNEVASLDSKWKTWQISIHGSKIDKNRVVSHWKSFVLLSESAILTLYVDPLQNRLIKDNNYKNFLPCLGFSTKVTYTGYFRPPVWYLYRPKKGLGGGGLFWFIRYVCQKISVWHIIVSDLPSGLFIEQRWTKKEHSFPSLTPHFQPQRNKKNNCRPSKLLQKGSLWEVHAFGLLRYVKRAARNIILKVFIPL